MNVTAVHSPQPQTTLLQRQLPRRRTLPLSRTQVMRSDAPDTLVASTTSARRDGFALSQLPMYWSVRPCVAASVGTAARMAAKAVQHAGGGAERKRRALS